MVFTRRRKVTEDTQIMDAVNELSDKVNNQPTEWSAVVEERLLTIVDERVVLWLGARLDAMETRQRRDMAKGFEELRKELPSEIDFIEAAEKAESDKDKLRRLCSIRDELLHNAKQSVGNPLLVGKEGNKLKSFTKEGWNVYRRITELISNLSEVTNSNPERYENHWNIKKFFKSIGEQYEGKESVVLSEGNKMFTTVRANIFSRGFAETYINYVIDNYVQPEIDALERE